VDENVPDVYDGVHENGSGFAPGELEIHRDGRGDGDFGGAGMGHIPGGYGQNHDPAWGEDGGGGSIFSFNRWINEDFTEEYEQRQMATEEE